VFVIGEGGILTALHERKIANDGIDPRYVVVGEGATTLEKLHKAHECIERGARLLATNPIIGVPFPAKRHAGAGATAAFLEASTGVRRISWASLTVTCSSAPGANSASLLWLS